MAKRFCERFIKGIAPHRCGLKAVRQVDGKWLCGGCVTIEKRNVTRRINKRKVEAEHERKVAEWKARTVSAAKALGIKNVTLSSFMSTYFEAVVIPLADFERLAKTLSAKGDKPRVRAVNAYSALVSAVQAASDFLDDIEPTIEKSDALAAQLDAALVLATANAPERDAETQ